ncbi:kinesin-like protein KIN12B-like [Trifolium pratense]|uniref:Uncharacterized protein n=2 Tax=Trifolium pratense TaxID=57577 RepID=A0ACB0I6X4_TRIPR|nr:kinesin-like protein KIN12B-like [Trifolium pratense]CAJ2627635.1 unnamed protein product [Trifolium pratense]
MHDEVNQLLEVICELKLQQYKHERECNKNVGQTCSLAEESFKIKLEQERNQWTEAESRWISLSEKLRAEVEANSCELDAERNCSKELKDALQIAIKDRARILEQYADLEEKHVKLLERHRTIHDGIDDKNATSEAGDQFQIKTRQPIKLSSSLTKLTNLELTEEKKMLMNTSNFYKLCQVENSKESSSTLSTTDLWAVYFWMGGSENFTGGRIDGILSYMSA